MARKSTGRKRERGDHSLEPNKREHSDTTDDRYMEPTVRLEDMEEVEALTDPLSGGLAFPAGVIKMLDIMTTVQLDSDAPMHATEMALAKRALLAKIVASTSRADCAALFFREGGLDALQTWLREAVQAAPNFPTCRAHIDALLVALLIAVERMRESPARLQESTLEIVERLGGAECQFSDQVRLRAVRLGRSWGAEERRRVWDCGDSSTSGAERTAVGTSHPHTTHPSPTTSTDRTTDPPGGVTAVGGVPWGGDALAGVEEAAGIMRLVTMNSPVAGTASAPSASSFGVQMEDGSRRQADEQRQRQDRGGSSKGGGGGLLGGAATPGQEGSGGLPLSASQRQLREQACGSGASGGQQESRAGAEEDGERGAHKAGLAGTEGRRAACSEQGRMRRSEGAEETTRRDDSWEQQPRMASAGGIS